MKPPPNPTGKLSALSAIFRFLCEENRLIKHKYTMVIRITKDCLDAFAGGYAGYATD
jgi:hypothetical protein